MLTVHEEEQGLRAVYTGLNRECCGHSVLIASHSLCSLARCWPGINPGQHRLLPVEG